MGVRYLWDILESCKKTLPLHHLQNKKVCVDLSCWIVQLHNVNRSHCPLKDKVYLKGLFHRLRALIALNCSLVFVTDGSIPAIKLSTYRRRLNAVNEPVLEPCKLLPVKRNMGSEFSRMIKEAKLLGAALGIPCLDGIEEAEAQCALLNSESFCDGCYSSDSDAFLFGARTVYREICLGEGGYVICYEMDDIERQLGFGRNSLISLAILLGSDYTPGIRGFGPESACKIVKSLGDKAVLQQFTSEDLPILTKPKSLKQRAQGDNENAGLKNLQVERDCDVREMKNHFLSVINAYLKPRCHAAESEIVHRVLAVYPFNRGQLHEICAQFFEWPPEKTDDYILPKVAERSLRRFSNLRSSSLKFGVDLPLDEMPVKCPVSCLKKQRKIHGKDYFEVCWVDMDGLNASTVPADILESACPEMIHEFHQSKLRKPQQQPMRRKKAEIEEIDEKLNKLLLQERFMTTTSQEEADNNSNGCSSEIIDLCSPPLPPPPQRTEVCDLIELSDTDSEISPEHARKARELRIFISTIE